MSAGAAEPLLLPAGAAPMPVPDRNVLPRGRHALSPERVSESQRRRMLRAVIDEAAEHGYAEVTATRVFRRAGVSSRAFYAHFRDVEDCFLAAYDECVRDTERALAAERPRRGDPAMRRFARLLHTYLNLLAAHPGVAATFLVEIYAAGPAARARRLEVHARFVAHVRKALRRPGGLSAAEAAAVETLVDATVSRVTRAVLAGALAERVPQIHADILDAAARLCPWLGAVPDGADSG